MQSWLAGIGARAGVRNCAHGGDRAALAALHAATGGRNWTNNSGWLSDAPLNEWYGVTTDADGRVSRLELDTNGLSGEVPGQVGDLSALSVLELHNNPELSGALPGTMSSLDALRSLDLRQTRLCAPTSLRQWLGGIRSPAGVRHCDDWRALEALHGATAGNNWTNDSGWLSAAAFDDWHGVTTDGNGRVFTLILDGNGLSGELPPELGRLSALTALDLTENPGLTGPLPGTLSSLDALRRLELTGTKVCAPNEGAFQSWLARLGSTRGVRNCAYGEDRAVLEAFYHATGGPNWLYDANWLSERPLGVWAGVATDGSGNVTRLDLSYNGLSGGLPSQLGYLANIEELDLGRNQLSGRIPAELGDLVSLTSLWLGANRLNGPIPAELGDLVNLTSLWLGANRLSGPIPAELGNLIGLEELLLADNQLRGPLPDSFVSLTALRELDLSNNAGVCAPADAVFQNWLAGVPTKKGVVNCP